jgi:osmoprotectant transport system ATP-binding protein
VNDVQTNRGPRVTLSGVTKRYGGRGGIDAVSLDIAAGSFVALVGASGSGKSTLLKAINRMIEPDAGTVTIDGADVCGEEVHRLRRRIGYVIQGTGLFPHFDVGANIAMGLRIGGLRMAGARDTDARVSELLDLVDLPQDFARRDPATLSGGQRQRVGFARALAPAPGLMLMDEPFGALDPVTRDALCDAYRGLHDRLGLTSIMVTHDMAEALLIADRIVVLSEGHVVADEAPGALLGGAGGAAAQALVSVPKRQAARLGELLPPLPFRGEGRGEGASEASAASDATLPLSPLAARVALSPEGEREK